jgi:hypothetical protein
MLSYPLLSCCARLGWSLVPVLDHHYHMEDAAPLSRGFNLSFPNATASRISEATSPSS